MHETILSVRSLTKRFGGIAANDAINLDLTPFETHAIIGPNGAGKSTLISQLAGEIRPDSGTIRLSGSDITRLPVHRRAGLGLVRSYQITSVMLSLTVLENAMLGGMPGASHRRHWLRAADRDPRLCRVAHGVLERVGLRGRERIPAYKLSHGERRQLEIAIALAASPRLLLLDDPTSGLGADQTDGMIRLLADLGGSVGIELVEKDMDVVFALADRITVLSAGQVIASGAPEEIRASRVVREAYLGVADG
jgi:branched-chain amino acid transport system ATP-binding protein